ncbi:MAG: glycosyltransferase family 39 protein [Deltaproteobacteria bacterium]|nr:glycosyltransferase family 39 protein [Deltaproteobacteria bacterium]
MWEQVLRAAESPWFLPTILLLALGLRLWHVLALRAHPFFDNLQLDPRAYDEWAQQIAAGKLVGSSAFFVDPLYAYFLAGLYRLFGHSLLAVQLVQVLLGVGTCWLTALLGRCVLGQTGLGNLAGALMVAFLPAIHYGAVIEKTTLSVFLFTLALVLFFGSSRRASLGSGVALGLAVLTRGNLLLFAPTGAAMLFFDRSVDNPHFRWQRMGLFLAGSFFMVSLATIHNWRASGEFVLTTTNLGQNLYIGQHRGNALGAYDAPSFVRPDPRYEENDFRAEAERRLGRTLTASEVSGYWRNQAFVEMAAAPEAVVSRTLSKLRLFWHQYELPDNENLEVVAEYSSVLRLPLLGMGMLFPLALLGAVIGWRSNYRIRVLVGVTLLYLASVLAFFVLSRFRVQLVPSLAVLAVAAVAWLAEANMPRARLGFAILLVAIAATFSFTWPSWLVQRRLANLAISYHGLGAQLASSGDLDAAIRSYERAVATAPSAVIVSMRELGTLYLRRGNFEAAERHMRNVVELKPQSRRGWTALTRLYEAMLATKRYRDDTVIKEKLAAAYRAAGSPDNAARLEGDS